MHPTIGRVVIYHTTENQQVAMRNSNNCNVQLVLPATVVSVSSPRIVNLKVHLDGEGDLWVTSAIEGMQEGQWEWPKITSQLGEIKVT